MLQHIKGDSSKWVNATKGGLHKFGWQGGYSAFSVSKSNSPHVARYIQSQADHHRQADFKTELLMLLAKHEIEIDERYI